MADLFVQRDRRQDGYAGACPVTGKVVRQPALGQILRDSPVVLVDALRVTRATQRLQAANVRADERLRVAAKSLDIGAGPLQMRRWPVDAALAGDVENIAIGRARLNRGGANRDNHAAS